MKLVALLALSFLLFGCANKKSSDTHKARTGLIGMSKAEILSCAGTPAKSVKSNNIEVLTYSYAGGQPLSGAGVPQQGQCSASFVFQRDRLTRLDYTGRTGGLATQGEQCGFIVANCINR
jgi:hypothetical protein